MDIPFSEDLPEDPREAKRLLRRNLRAARAVMAHAAAPVAARKVRDRVLALLAAHFPPPKCVAAYWPTSHELDVRPLMASLVERHYTVLLPVVTVGAAPLCFRRWQPGMKLVEGAHGIPVPPPESGEARPDVVLLPLVGFDRHGYRLGQGGGHYDRTLAALRQQGPVAAIGIAYAGQEIDRVPVEPHDQPLDWIVTEAMTFGPFSRLESP